MHKLVFHIPCCTCKNGVLQPVPWQQVIDKFAQELYLHTDGFFVTDAIGYYKGRSYAEKLLTVYCDSSTVTADFLRIARVLEQEAYAYEIDDRLVIE